MDVVRSFRNFVSAQRERLGRKGVAVAIAGFLYTIFARIQDVDYAVGHRKGVGRVWAVVWGFLLRNVGVVFLIVGLVLVVGLHFYDQRQRTPATSPDANPKTKPPRWEPSAEVLEDNRIRLVLSGPTNHKPAWWECEVTDPGHDWVGRATPKALSRHQSPPIFHLFPDDFDAGVPPYVPAGSYRVVWTQTQHVDPENPTVTRLAELQFQIPRSVRHDHSALWVPETNYVLEDVFGPGVRLEISGPLRDGLCNFRCRVDLPDDTSFFAEDAQRKALIDASQPSTGSDFHYPGEFKSTREDPDKFPVGDYVAIWSAIEMIDPDGIGTEALPLTLAVVRFHFDGLGRFGLGTLAEPSR